MPEIQQHNSDDYYIRKSVEDNLNSRMISPRTPAKSETFNGHVTNLLRFVDPQGSRTAARQTDTIMNTEELKQHYTKALRDVGAPEEYTKFFADVVQTENDIDINIHNIHGKLSTDNDSNATPEHLLKTIQELTKGYNAWKTEIDSLSSRSKALGPLKIDSNRVNQTQAIKALCSIRTKDLNVAPGDEMKILDTTKPNQLKVRTNRGDEGYIPALSCLLPSPDKNAITAPDRLKLQLMASWRDSMNKSKSCLVKCLVDTSKQLNQEWKNKTSIHSTGAKERVSRRLRRLMESLNTQLPNWDLTKLHNSLFSIEKELCSWNGAGSDIEPVINVIASLDKTVLCYQMFRKQWYLYRRSLEQCPRPMRIVDNVQQLRTVKSCKNFRYYEVKVTREEVETVEEVVETRKPKSTVQAEQITTTSAEERRKFIITGVIDPRSGEEISFQDAINARIIDQSRGMYLNPNTGGGMSIPEAMNEGRIKVGSSTAEVTKEETKALGLITIKSRVEHRHMTIKQVTDAVSGKIMTLEEAKKAGIIDETNTHYTVSNTGEKVDLEKAIQGGWVTVDNETSVTEPEYETKTYAVNAVVDQVNRKKVPFGDAVMLGLIDKDTGNYVNNVTGEKVYVTEAIKRGFLKAYEVDSSDGLNIDTENKVVVERMEKIRRNVLKSMGVIKAFKMGKKKKPGDPTSPEPHKPVSPSTQEQKTPLPEQEPVQKSTAQEVQAQVVSDEAEERLKGDQHEKEPKMAQPEPNSEKQNGPQKQQAINAEEIENKEEQDQGKIDANLNERQQQNDLQPDVQKPEDTSNQQNKENIGDMQSPKHAPVPVLKGISQPKAEKTKRQPTEVEAKSNKQNQEKIPEEPRVSQQQRDFQTGETKKDEKKLQQTEKQEQTDPAHKNVSKPNVEDVKEKPLDAEGEGNKQNPVRTIEEPKISQPQPELQNKQIIRDDEHKSQQTGKQAQPIPNVVSQPKADENKEKTKDKGKSETKVETKPQVPQQPVKTPQMPEPEVRPVPQAKVSPQKVKGATAAAKESKSKSSSSKQDESKSSVNGEASKQENTPQKKKKDKKKSWWKRKK